MLKLSRCVCVHVRLCLTLCYSTDCGLPVFSIHGIFQARILVRVAIPFSRGSSWPRVQTWVSYIDWQFFTSWATGEHTYSYWTDWQGIRHLQKTKYWGYLATGTHLLCSWECGLIQAIQRGNLALFCEIKDACLLRFRTSSFYPRKKFSHRM